MLSINCLLMCITCLQSVWFIRFLGDLKVVQQRAIQMSTQTLVSTSFRCKKKYFNLIRLIFILGNINTKEPCK